MYCWGNVWYSFMIVSGFCSCISVFITVNSRYIKNNAWVTVNNDFWVTSEAICEWFSRVTKSNRITSDPKIVIHGNKCIILFLTRYFMSLEHTILLKTSLIAHFATVAKDGLFWLRIVTSPELICDVTLTRDTSIVTSHSSIVVAHANWRKSDLH